MEISLETQLLIQGAKVMSKGRFMVNDKEFKADPIFTAAVKAYEWIHKQKWDTGFRDTIILKVLYNGENDITESVRQIRPVIKDDLPF